MLVDVLTRHVVRASPAARYFALSYVWGNVTGESASGLVSSSTGYRLPDQAKQTIEDAITLTKGLGEKYLWVDVYCVDQHIAEKQKQQINHMGSIFQGAAVTIVALSGGSASAGLAGISRTTGPRPFFASPAKSGIAANLISGREAIVNSSAWSTRAWTFQDELLSRRLLFLADQQYWLKCQHNVYSRHTARTRERDDSPRNTLARLLNTNAASFRMVCDPSRGHAIVSSHSDLQVHDFFAMVTEYASRQETYEGTL